MFRIKLFKLVLSFTFLILLFSQKLYAIDENLIPVSGLEQATTVLPYQSQVYTGNEYLEYEFLVEPTTIMSTYLYSLPSKYAKFPIKKQLINGSGTYLSFLAKDSTSTPPKQHWAYYDEIGNLQDIDTFPTNNYVHNSGDITLHQATGNCIASWSATQSGNADQCTICFDDYASQLFPGNWSNLANIPQGSGDYTHPRLFTGSSPNGSGWVRIFHISQNVNPNSSGYICNEVRIMYIDVPNNEGANLTQLLDMNNWTTVTPMQLWYEKSCKLKSLNFAVRDSDGHVGLMGYCRWMEGDLGNMPVNPGFFLWESNDYGQTWDYTNLFCYSQDTTEVLYQVENQPEFEFAGTVPESLDVKVLGFNNSGYCSAGTYVMNFVQGFTYTNPETNEEYYLEYFIPQAEVLWRTYENEFEINTVPQLPGVDYSTMHRFPWVVTENDTTLYVVVTASSDYPDLQRNAISISDYFFYPRIQIWTDFTYHTLSELGYSQFDEYYEHPVINFAYEYLMWNSMFDQIYGSWIGMIELTDLDNPFFDFSNQITVFPFIDDNINFIEARRDFWTGWYHIYLYYYDDNTFGTGSIPNTGGNLKYSVLRFGIWQFNVDTENTYDFSYNNFPNPFSNQTKISFSAENTYQRSLIKIYNSKGQLVKQLEPESGNSPESGYAIWDGSDMNGNSVGNGVYFYEIDLDDRSCLDKILLIR